MSVRVEQIGACTLVLGDNREALATLDLPKAAALIGDPPYGQLHKTNIVQKGGLRTYGNLGPRGGERVLSVNARSRNGCYGGSGLVTVWPDQIHGDDRAFDPDHWLQLAPVVCLWGAHKFADRLPRGGWLVWDKVPTGKLRDQGDGEAAWINRDQPMRIHRLLWDGVCVGSAARREVCSGQARVHPKQKPAALMEWCIEQARVPPDGVILDPWMGSGSTLVAAVRRGHPAVGIEIEPRYFETACRRVEAASRQADLFVPAPDLEAAYQPQSSLFDDAGAM